MSDHRFDVIIVGAWPAGSRLADLLGQEGYRVLLIDKSPFPRNKPCGGGIAQGAIRHLGYELPPEIVESAIDEMHFSFRSHTIVKRYPGCIAQTVRRDAFDHFLLRQATRHAGVTFVVGDIDEITQDDACVTARVSGVLYTARILVWADGANSVVRRRCFDVLKRAWWSPRAVAVAFDRCALDPGRYRRNALYFFFGEDRGGYRWIFPNRPGEYNIGVGLFASSAHDIRWKLADFSTSLGGQSEHDMIGHILPYGCNRGRNGSGRILLIGDAAGLIDPFTGEGIGNAILSADIAARIIIWSAWDDRTIGKRYDRAMCPVYIDLWLMLLFSYVFHACYPIAERIVLANDFVIDWYVEVARGDIRPRDFFFRFVRCLPYLVYRAYRKNPCAP